jgi:hypothetical protein
MAQGVGLSLAETGGLAVASGRLHFSEASKVSLKQQNLSRRRLRDQSRAQDGRLRANGALICP